VEAVSAFSAVGRERKKPLLLETGAKNGQRPLSHRKARETREILISADFGKRSLLGLLLFSATFGAHRV
jgi:hypothetical protein